MKRIFIGAASLLMSFALLAEEATSDDAELVAKAWARDNAQGFGERLGALVSVKAETNAAGETLWFWVVFEKGAIVIAPDTEIDPVIAMLPGNDGTLPAGHPMRTMLLRDMSQRLGYAKTLRPTSGGRPRLMGAAKPLSRAAARWEQLKKRASARQLTAAYPEPTRVISLLKGFRPEDEETGDTLRFWNQNNSPSYFNDPNIFSQLTPRFGLVQAPCGCVATAGATVLNYFEAPGCAKVSRECEVAQVGKTNLWTVGGTYDWSCLQPRVDCPRDLAEDELELLGRVAWDVGVASHMSYGPAGSGAFTFDLGYALRTDFGLQSARWVNQNGPSRGNVSPIESKYYEKLVYNQIRGGLPVIFGISYSQSAEGGHEVVAVGYGVDDESRDFTFVFTGWGGLGDAWYQLPDIDTKATVDGDSYTYDIIGDMITQLSLDGKSIPLVGRVTDTAGVAVANAPVWLEGGTAEAGTLVRTDANGYWSLQVSPQFQPRVVYDPTGCAHTFAVGENAYPPKGDDLVSGSAGYIAAKDLAAALPDVMDFEVDRSKIIVDPSEITFLSDPETAKKQALAEGKPLYVFGCAAGSTEPTETEYMAYLREKAEQEPGFATKYVFLRFDAIVQTGAAYAIVDPRTFDRTKVEYDWDEEVIQIGETEYAVWKATPGENGCVDPDDPESWDPIEAFTVESATISGPARLVSGENGQYKLTIVYNDGTEQVVTTADWAVSPASAATIGGNGFLVPTPGAVSTVNVTVDLRIGSWTEPVTVDPYPVEIGEGALTVIGGDRNDPLIAAAVPGDLNVTTNAQQIVLAGNVSPSATDPVRGGITRGGTVTVEAKRELEFAGQPYRLRCVDMQVLTGTVARAVMEDVPVTVSVVTNQEKGVETVATFVPQMLTNYVRWVWETSAWKIRIRAGDGVTIPENLGLDPDGYVWAEAGAPFDVNVTLDDPADSAAVWTGCAAGELFAATQAKLAITAARDITVFAQKTNTEFTVAKDLAPVVGPGYELTLVEEGETEDMYVVNVKKGSEIVQPDPIAFKSITRVDETTWELVVTNIVEFCNYRLIYTDDLTKGFTVTGDWQQATGPMVPTWTTNVVTSAGQYFWKAEAKEGEKP